MKHAKLSFLIGLLAVGCSTVEIPTVDREVSSVEADDAWKKVLATYVDSSGRVDFEGVKKAPTNLERYVHYVSKIGPKTNPELFPTPESRMAYYINSYNALSMYNIIDYGIPDSLSGLKKVKFFYFRKFIISKEKMSLYAYENEVIRKLGEERIHFALNCMSKGCPVLPKVPFKGETLNQTLEAQAKFFFNEERNVHVDNTKKTVHISEILDFFPEDFLQKAPSLIAYVNKYRNAKVPEEYKVEFIPYDWGVNSQPIPGKSLSNRPQSSTGSNS